jgi:hypothetical protein
VTSHGVIDESERVLGAALDALSSLSSDPQIDIDKQLQSDGGPTSIQELTTEGPEMKALLHEILDGTGAPSDRVRSRQVSDLFNFSIKLTAAADECGRLDSTGLLAKESLSFFRGMAMLDSLADAFSAGLRLGRQERASNRGKDDARTRHTAR